MKKLAQGLGIAALLLVAACGRVGGGSDGWVSSGGELFQGRQNPWWLKNVRRVNYCVLVDPGTSSVKRADAETNVHLALEFWKHEFARDSHEFFQAPKEEESFSPHGIRLKESLGVATQRFVPGPCATADLKILFGSGALSKDERAFLAPGLTRHLAAAVRTSYDEVTLKGKGFVYIASDKGDDAPKAFRLENAPTPADAALLLPLLAHELGHVFGIPHVGPRSSLMAERFPAALLENLRYVPAADRASQAFLPSFFATPQRFIECNRERKYEVAAKFFGVDFKKDPEACPSYAFQPGGKKIEISLVGRQPDFRQALGTMENIVQQNDYLPAYTVELTSPQEVFPSLGTETLLGPPLLRASTLYGMWRSPDAKKTSPMVLGVEGAGCWRFTVAGALDGKLTPLWEPQSYRCH